MIESFWSRLQVELLDRQCWRARVELANAFFGYLEIWHNRRRRHSRLGMLPRIEFENPKTSNRGMRIQQHDSAELGHPTAPANQAGSTSFPRWRDRCLPG